MKVRLLLLSMLMVVLAGLPALVQAQESGVVVLKFNWERERLTMNPSVAPLASQDELLTQSRRERQLATARNAADGGKAGKLETETVNHEQASIKARQSEMPRDGYRYKVTLRNDGSKTIKSVDWDYIFLDPETKEEVARHQFSSDATLKPGSTKEVSVLYLVPPVKTVNVRILAKKDPMPFLQQAQVMRVLFADGSVWPQP